MMCRSIDQSSLRWAALGLAWLLGSGTVWADDGPAPAQVPAQEPLAGPAVSQPALPQPTTPPVVAATSREAELEARVQQLEAMVNQLTYQGGSAPAVAPVTVGGTGVMGGVSGAGPGFVNGPPVAEASGGVGGQTGGRAGGPGVPGRSFPPVPDVQPRFDIPATLENRPGHVKFGPGIEIATDDDEFIMQFHNLTQFDFRGYLQGNQYPTHDGFGFPRQWWMFNGHITKEIGFFHVDRQRL